MSAYTIGGDMAPSLGLDGKKLTPKFLNEIFFEKFPFLPLKFLMTVFRFCLSLLCQMFSMTYMYMDLSSREKPLFITKSFMTPSFTEFVLAYASDNTILLKILGEVCMGRLPHLKFGGTVPPFPLSLRPCMCVISSAFGKK